MMFKGLKKSTSKITAAVLAAVMLLTMIPFGTLVNVFAATVDRYTVTLTDGSAVIGLDDVQITLTDKEDNSNSFTQGTVNGVATFENSVEEGKTYTVSVAEIIGYEAVNDFEVTPNSDKTNDDVTLVAIDKITLSGKVVDENGAPYVGAKVELKDYINETMESDENGNYSFSVYKGKNYTVTATAKEAKYETTSTNITHPTTDYTCSTLQFNVKTFKITTSAGPNGRITAPESNIEYGSTRTITISADKGYRVDKLTGGGDAEKAHGAQEYSFNIENISENKNISVTFYKQTYTVSFDVSANGKVTYNTDKTAEGGKVTAVTVDENGTVDFKAIANSADGYHIKEVRVGDDVTLENGTNEITEKAYTVPEVTQDVTVTVVFDINTYDITINNGENGTIAIDSEEIKSKTVDYGSNATISVAANDGYYLSKFDVDGSDKLSEISDKDLFEYSINNIQSGIQIDIEFSKKSSISVDNVISNDYFDITFSDPVVNMNNTYIVGKSGTITITPKNNNNIRIVSGQFWFFGYHNTYDEGTITYSSNKDIRTVEVKEGNKWKNVFIDISFIVDTKSPAISNITKEPNKDFNNKEYTITATVTDDNAGVDKVYYSATNDFSTAVEAKYDSTTNIATFVTDNTENNYEYFIWAVDKVENLTPDNNVKSIPVAVDTTKPTIDSFEFTSNSLNVCEFGTFSSDDIKVTIKASDKASEIVNSGIESITFNGQTVESKNFKNGVAEFTLEAKDFSVTKEVTATATDNAGMVSEIAIPTSYNSNIKSNKITISDVKATVETSRKDNAKYINGEEYWYAGNTDFTVKVADEFGIQSVVIKMNGIEVLAENYNNSASAITSKEYTINTSENPIDGKNEITVEVVNVNNNSSDNGDSTSKTVYIDTTKPDVTNFEITRVGGTPLEKVINFLTFGVFFNDKVEITITAQDDNASGGINTITLYANGTTLETKVVDNENKAKFTVPTKDITDETVHFNKLLSAIATDNVGNNTDVAVEPTTVNSDIANSKLMIETKKPLIDVLVSVPANSKNNETADNNDWYASDIDFNIAISDTDSGIRRVSVKINGTDITTDKDNKNIADVFYKKNETTNLTFKVNTDQAVRNEDGSYTIEILVTDNAGNVSDTYEKTIYKDIDKPYITGFDFEPEKYVEGSETASTVEVTDYGFYFKENTKVTISSKDDAPTAGIKGITYYTVDKDTGKSEETFKAVNADGTIEFTIEKDFKGQIYAKATDNVDNIQDEFVNPNSAIVEKEEKHNEETHIAFAKNNTSFATRNGSELYATDVPVTITITDTYSGIREIEWEVVAPYDTENNQSGKITVNNDKSIAEGSDSDWKQTKSESNLVTEMEKTITVNNNSNDIVVKVKMMDRAGNTSEKEITFSIDKTKPVIEVTYDNNVPDDTYKDVYKENRTATIKITERNFDSKDIVYQITNTDGVIPTLSDWKEMENPENPDETYNIATISYTADGDYTFDISYSDLAKNATDEFAQHAFTIDKTMPTVTVTYDNNSALNGNYYKADRTATITIVEHNFDSARVNVIGTATDNGTNLSFPTTSSWTDNGDTHVATINYSFDSKFTFDIEFSDMAGNPIADYTAEEFFVDKTAPTLEISGVEDKSANNGTVAPIVTYTDTNFNTDAVTIELNGVNNGKVNYAVSTKDIDNGQEYAYADFDKVQEVDDIYTLSATLTDKAGNETKKEIMFSANRFGSVYTFDTYLKNIEGKYTNAEQNVVFTETNVDTLDHESILLKLFKDGTPTDLKEGQDYTVTHTGGDGKWSQYEYVVSKELFANDGKYRMTVYSKDRAGNVNENIEESKKAEISFGIDKTKPVIVPIDFESGKQYPVEVKTVKAEIKDNLVLENVKIYLGEEKAENEIKYTVDGETYTFDIPQSNEKQTVLFVATDAASNEYKLSVEDFLVSTNIFVRWYNNTPLFIGSIIGVVVLAVGLAAFLIFGKKKKKDDEDEKEKF